MKIFSTGTILKLSAILFLTGCHHQNKNQDQGFVNIIFLFTDDQRFDALGYAGNPVLNTPNLDKLASQGLYFDNAFVTTSICYASRAIALTGQYVRFTGPENFKTTIDLDITYPRYLKEGGYHTGFIGKWGLSETDTVYYIESANLFDFWAGSMNQSNYWHERDCNYVLNNGTTEKENFFCNCPPDAQGRIGEMSRSGKANIKDPVHMDTYIIPEKVRMFLNQRDSDKPFCLSISFKSPHGPFGDYDECFAEDYKGIQMPLLPSVNIEEAMKKPEFLSFSHNTHGDLEVIQDAHNINGRLQDNLRNYYRLLNGTDYAVGEILKELHERGLNDNTVIIFFSDNGYFFGEHGFTTGKWLMYEESLRVPGFVFDPRNITKGVRTKEMVLNLDLAPTILDLAGLDIPDQMQGKSFLPLLNNPEKPFREDFFYEHHFRLGRDAVRNIARSEGIRTRDWKYINYIDQVGAVAEELYDLDDDPYEMNDLSENPAYTEQLNQLRARYQSFFD